MAERTIVESILEQERDPNKLQARIRANQKNEAVDLAEWVFQGLKIPTGSSVLELCSGTGAQTFGLLERVGVAGKVVAVDASSQVLAGMFSHVPPDQRGRLVTVATQMEDMDSALQAIGLHQGAFTAGFCAYGLYYSREPQRTLQSLKQWIRDDGRLVIIGPFGPNNDPLFAFLAGQGVVIPEFVQYTSSNFMQDTVLPFAATAFEETNIRTLMNAITWKRSEDVMTYWLNSTFYDKSLHQKVQSALQSHFQEHGKFVNQKWVMMMTMQGKRA